MKFFNLLILFPAFISCEKSGSKFAVGKIENITEIELCEKHNCITLSKADGNRWLADGFKANTRNVSNLKKIISNIEVRYPLPKMYEKTYSFKKIAEEGIHLKISGRKKIEKDFYLLFTDSIGTLAAEKDGKQAYAVDFTGQNVDLKDYIRLEASFWEDNTALSIKAEEIKSVKLENVYDGDNSFLIRKSGDSIRVCTLKGDTVQYNSDKVRRYLTYFSGVCFENNLKLGEAEKREIISSKPMYILSVETASEQYDCTVYPVKDDGTDDYGNQTVYSRDFFYLSIPQKQLLAKTGWLEFDILLEELKYFME